MPSPFSSPWRRESRGSTEPRPNSRPSSRDNPRLSYSPAQGTHEIPHVPRATTSRRVAALRERTLASTAASLRVAEHTERVAGATLRELDAQSESLERTRKNLDDAEKSAEEGERTLDEMRACGVSCFSLRGLFRSSRRTPPDAATPNLAGAESRGDVADARDELSRRAAAKKKNKSDDDDEDDDASLERNGLFEGRRDRRERRGSLRLSGRAAPRERGDGREAGRADANRRRRRVAFFVSSCKAGARRVERRRVSKQTEERQKRTR